jgi:filamentous hemagglutinin family protein
MKRLLTTTALMLALAGLAFALPQGGQVVGGAASMNQPDAGTLNVTQTTDRAIIDWNSYNIGAGESVWYGMPGAGSISLNRVTGGNASRIYGQLSGNGKIYLINPQGIVFGQGSHVDVGGLLATTGDIDNGAFMAGTPMRFDGAAGAITNDGDIAVAPGGYAILAAPTVANNGTISAPGGQIGLAGARAFVVDPVGDNLLTLSPDPAQFNLNVANTGHLAAGGGRIALTTQQTDAAYASVVNAGGLIEANTFQNVGGHIVLGAAPTQLTNVTGQVRANGADAAGNGNAGAVDVVGQFVDVKTGAAIAADAGRNGNGGQVNMLASRDAYLFGTATARGGAAGGNGGALELSGQRNAYMRGSVDTAAPHGRTGTFLIDPADITVAAGNGGADDSQLLDDDQILAGDGAGAYTISEQALEGITGATNITLEATNDITIDPLSDGALTLGTTGNVAFRADSDGDGSGAFGMNAADRILTGGALTLQGAGIAAGQLDTSAGMGGITLATTGGTGAITLNGDLVTGGGAIALNGNATTTANTTLASTGGAIALGGATNASGHSLTLNAGTGALTLGPVTADTLALTGGATTLGGNIASKNDLAFTSVGAITLGADSAITAQNGGTRHAITFNAGNAIGGAHNLSLTGSAITLPAASGLTGLTLNGDVAGTVGNIATSGNQTYTNAAGLSTNGTLASSGGNVTVNAPLSLAGDTTLNAAAGAVAVNGTVNGAHALAANAGGNVTLAQDVGVIAKPTAVTLSGGGVHVGNVATTGNQSYGGPTTAGGTYRADNGTVSFNGNTTLAADTTVNTSAGNKAITFGGTLNGAHALTANAGSGNVAFNGLVGASTALASLASTGATTVAGGGLTTTGAQTYNGPVTLNGFLTAGDALTINGGLALSNNSTLASGGGQDIAIAGATTGAHTLSLAAGTGDIRLGPVTADGLTFLSGDDLFLNGDVATQSALDFSPLDDITLLGNSALTAGPALGRQNITMDAGNQVTGNFNLALTGDTLTLGNIFGVNALTLAGTNTVMENPVSTNGAITVNGPSTLHAAIATAGAPVTFNGTTTLGGDSSIATAGGDVGFTAPLNGPYSLTVNSGSGDTALAGGAGDITPLNNLDVTAAAFDVGGPLALAGALTTHAASTFHGAVDASSIDLTGANTILAPMTSGADLLLTGNTMLGSILTAAGNLGLAGGTTLVGNGTLVSGGGAGNLLSIAGGVTGPYDLMLQAGAGDIAMSGDADVNRLDFQSGHNLHYGGGTLQALQGLDFTPLNEILLGGDTRLVGGDGATQRADVTAGLTNTVLATAPGVDLSIFGDVVNMNQMGDPGAGRLQSLAIDANIASLLGSVYTVGAQTINAHQGLAGLLTSDGGNITLNTTADLVGDIHAISNGGDIFINQPLNGGFGMILDAGAGDVYINAALGNVTPLTTMQIIGSVINLNAPITTTADQDYNGKVNLNTALTLTLGNITYHDAVLLTGDTTLDTAGGNGTITFDGAVDGGHALTLRAGPTGSVLFNGTAGAQQRLGDLAVQSAHDITFTHGVYAKSYNQAEIDGLASFGFDPGLDVTENINVNVSHDLEGRFTGYDIALNAGGSIVGEAYAGHSLSLSSNRTLLTGSVRGETGKRGAELVTFGRFFGGPHYFNNYNLPVVDDFYALPPLVARRFAAPESPTGAVLSLPGYAVPLDPFDTGNPLLVAGDALSLASDPLGDLFPDKPAPTRDPDPLKD